MKLRDILILPLGDYNLTDGICDYILIKSMSNYFKKPFCQIREYGKLTSGSISLYEEEVDIYEDSDLYKKQTYAISAHIAGLHVHGGNNINSLLRGLRFKPKTSYKEWISITNQ
jgi:hypothetical protein